MPPPYDFIHKKEIFESFGIYRTDLKVSADYDFILRVLKSDKVKLIISWKPIVKMSVGGISTSGFKSLIIKLKEDFIVLYAHYSVFAFIPLIMKRILKIQQFLFFRHS